MAIYTSLSGCPGGAHGTSTLKESFIQLWIQPPYSLLMFTNIIYNHVSTGRGLFYRHEVGGLAFTDELTYHTTI